MATHHPVAIIGAGLGGLAAARVLHVRGVPAAVFDLEGDRHARTQGGMLDIHDDSGQLALRAAGLWEPFTALVHPGGEAMRILDHTGAVLREEADSGDASRPEVDRGQLRDLLLDSLPDGAVHWGRKVTSVRRLDPQEAGSEGGARHEVVFADGEAITTDLLVGADGAWSRVRPLVSAATPAYSGISFVEADLRDVDARHPAQAAVVGAGMLFAFRGQTGVLAHRESDASVHVYLGVRVGEAYLDGIDFADAAGSRTAVLGLLDGWDEGLRGLVARADGPLVPRRINVLPAGHRWERTPGVTLLGDAAHVMSPFAGEGANLALFDGAQLASAVADHPGDLEAALGAYEVEAFARAERAAAESARNLETMFSADSPAGLVAFFAEMDAEHPAG